MKRAGLWLRAARPYAYSTSVIPVLIGALHVRGRGGPFSGLHLGVTLAAALLIHTAANLWNDYFDFKLGVDRAGGGTGSGMLVRGEMTPAQIFGGASLCALASLALGLWLAGRAGWGLAWLFPFGFLGALLYCAGRFSPKHVALGEVWLFLTMGVGLTLGGAMAQTGKFSWGAIAAGTPAGLLMTLLLYINNIRDMRSDREAGLATLPMRLGARPYRLPAALTLAMAYGLTGWLAWTGHAPPTVWLAWVSLPQALWWARPVWRGNVGEAQVKGVAMLHLSFGVLFAVGLALA